MRRRPSKSVLSISDLDGGRHFATPMDTLGQLNYGAMLSGLMVTTFLILLAASVAVVSLMALLPLIDLAFQKKDKPAPARVETWLYDGLSGSSWLALRSHFLRPDVVPRSQLRIYPAALERAIEHVTPLIGRSLVPKGSEPNNEEPERPSRAA